jgi:hypothetical protein
MISIVCVYNDRKILESYLLKGLQKQACAYELICLDNSQGQFASAAQALNHGTRQIQAASTHIMFAHQDVCFASPAWLEDAEKMLDTLQNLGIAGVVGCREGDRSRFSNITHGSPPRDVGIRIQQPLAAMTVDECCLFIPRHVFKKYQFDEAVCEGWHFYAVEYCLRIQEAGLGVYIVPLSLHHSSLGTQDSTYFQALKPVLDRHRQTYCKIYTTCGCWDTGKPVKLQRFWHYVRKTFYAVDNSLIAWGLMPACLLKKNRKMFRRNR